MSEFTERRDPPVRKEGSELVFPWVYYAAQAYRADDPVNALVLADFKARDEHGHREYGGPLVVDDGGHPPQEVYQEALDGFIYATQALLKGGLTYAETEAVGQASKAFLAAVFALRRAFYEKTGR